MFFVIVVKKFFVQAFSSFDRRWKLRRVGDAKKLILIVVFREIAFFFNS